MSTKSKRLYTTVSDELGSAFEALAKARMISEPELLRQIVSEYVTQQKPLGEDRDQKKMMIGLREAA